METDHLPNPSSQKSFTPTTPSTSSATFHESSGLVNKAVPVRLKPTNGHLPQTPKQSQHNGPGSSQSSVSVWKRMPTPIGHNPKENFFRMHGVCKEYPEYNVKEVRDPRIHKYRASNTVMEMPMPDFVVDDHYTSVPTNREFSITGLNDNIDEKFLRSLCKSEPAQVIVFHHPKTRRHLGLAFMDFPTKAESDAFLKKYNGKTLMGGKVTCFFDPLAYKISKLYEEATGGCVVPMPERYTHLVTNKSIGRMRDLVKKHYGDIQEDDSPVFIKQEHSSKSVVKTPTTPLETVHMAGINGTSLVKKPGMTPPGLPPKCTTPDTANLTLGIKLNRNEEAAKSPLLNLVDSSEMNYSCTTPFANRIPLLAQVCAGLEDRIDVEANNISLNSSVEKDFKHVSTTKLKSNKSRSQLPDDSDCSSSTSSSSKTYSSSPCPNYSREKWKSSQKKFLKPSLLASEPLIELQRVTSADYSPTYQQPNQNSRSSLKHRSSTKEQNDRSGAHKINSTPRKRRPSSKSEKNEESRKYRWSSSSSADSRSSNPRKEHKSSKRKQRKAAKPLEESIQSIQLPPTPNPPIFSPRIGAVPCISLCPKVSVQSPAITSTCSPTQPAIGVKPMQHQNLPPPGLIMPPTPVGLTQNRQQEQQKIEEVASTPKAMSLEQRLNAMFKKGVIKKEESSANTSKIKLETTEEAEKVKLEGNDKIVPLNDVALLSPSPSTSRVRDTISNHIVGSTSPRNPFRHRVISLHKTIERQEEENEQVRKARLDAQLNRERQQKIQRCVDVSRQARSTFSVEMIMVLHKDIQRRLEAEALKILDEKYQILEEQRKKQAKEQEEAVLLSSTKPNSLNSVVTLNQPLASLFPAMDTSMNVDDTMAANETIFGIPYQVRMASLPSFKKKKPAEVQNSLSKDRLYHIKKRREENESKRKAHRGRSSSEFSDKTVKRKGKANVLAKRVLHKRSLSSSSSESRSSSTSSIYVHGKRKELNISRISSADEAEPISESEEELEVKKSEQQIAKDNEKTILDQKRAILDSLLKGSREEEDDESSIQSCFTLLPSDLSETTKLIRPDLLRVSSPSTPPLIKKAKTSKELASLLHSDFVVPQQPVFKKEPKLWAPRNVEAELKLLYLFDTDNLSAEDCTYFKLATLKLEPLFEEQGLLPVGKKLQWTPPSTAVKQPKELPAPIKKDKCEFYYDDHELEGIVPHKSGCARTEGYYKISKQRKTLMRRHEDFANRTIISTQDETAVRHMTQASKDERAMNRRLLTWIGDSNLIRVNQLKYRSKMIKFARSQIHGWGLYALETIPPDVMIIEYVGEKVRPTVADEREKSYELRGMGSSYMFRIDGDAVIDATKQGNFGRFINHSCSPNCTARVVMVDGDKRIVIYSKRLISKGEEITYDYKFAREEEASKIECLCGSKCCQKFLN